MSEYARRQLLKFLGIAGGTVALGPLVSLREGTANIRNGASFLGSFTPAAGKIEPFIPPKTL